MGNSRNHCHILHPGGYGRDDGALGITNIDQVLSAYYLDFPSPLYKFGKGEQDFSRWRSRIKEVQQRVDTDLTDAIDNITEKDKGITDNQKK